MAKVSRGKDFELEIRQAFEREKNVSVDRLKDTMSGYMGDNNICDFIVYKKPRIYYLECKAIHGNTLNFKSDIRPNQWNGLSKKNMIDGVHAGFLVWFIDHDVTYYVDIQLMNSLRSKGIKSLRYDAVANSPLMFKIAGKKKRILFSYNMESFFNILESW